MPSFFLRDARLPQILFLSLFLVLGVATRDWSLHWELVTLNFLVCLGTQAALSYLTRRPRWNLLSAMVTPLSLSLMLRSHTAWAVALAAFLAIASKFVFSSNGKHWFNPANFGIVLSLLLTQETWISNGQWGTAAGLVLCFAALGGLITRRVGRLDTSVVFLLTYGGLELMRVLWLGWTLDVWLHRMSSGSLWLFAFFMLTDPRSIPNALWARMLWAGAIALSTFALQNFWFVPDALFYALFGMSLVTALVDRQWQAPRFEWQGSVRGAHPVY
ncbi:MAG: Na+-transporting NADH:ubiquinone oxidoreductase, subunit NqrB [Oscillatoriales cyanobacterium SM2_2_1]|nr:Na+-transporting NADH:ubiquinone oxidoreductase, subunit NqrB [Oscillatoriales cyanobacterium SM2_2_1]